MAFEGISLFLKSVPDTGPILTFPPAAIPFKIKMAASNPSFPVWHPQNTGHNDVLGAMNRITPDSIVAAVSLVRKGIVFDLSYDLEEAMRFPECTKGSSRLHSTRWQALRNRMKKIWGDSQWLLVSKPA
jgi:hypothetical protein